MHIPTRQEKLVLSVPEAAQLLARAYPEKLAD